MTKCALEYFWAGLHSNVQQCADTNDPVKHGEEAVEPIDDTATPGDLQ